MIFRWDDCELDDEAGELRRADARVEVQPKPFELLKLLLRAIPRTVSNDELMRSLWPGVVVTPASLNRAVTSARRAIGDTGRGQRVDSVPRRGYRFAGDVETLAGRPPIAPVGPIASIASIAPIAPVSPTAPVGPEASAPARFTTPFVGRAEAVATLRGARSAAAQGAGSVVLVAGPAGIGKTRLLRAFVADCERAGVRALVGHCRDREGAPAYWVWQQILTAVAEGRDTPNLRALREHAEALARADATRSDGPAAAPEQSRFLFFEAVHRVLREWAAESPGVIVLEDLQWAGSGSLALLEHVAYEIDSTRLLLVASLREEPASLRRAVDQTRVVLRRMEHCHPIELARFTRREIGELAEQVLGVSVPAEVVEVLDARTEGVPLFLRERLRELDGPIRSGESPEVALSRALAGDSPTLSLVRRAIEGLPESCVAYLEAAAVVGREFSLPYTAEVAGLSLEEAARAFDRASMAGVVEEAPQSASGRFFHALYREAVYDGIAVGRRALLHRRAAIALEKHALPDPLARSAELAYHHFESLAVGDPDAVLRFAGHAAAQASSRLWWEEAALQFERMSIALDHVGRSRPLEKLEALTRAGEAHALARNPERRRATLREAAALAQTLDRPVEQARAAIAYCDLSEWSPWDPDALPLVESALAALGTGHRVARAALETRRAYRHVRAERDEAQRLAREAVGLARATRDPELVQEALYVLLFSLAGPDQLAERAALRDGITVAARKATRRDTALIALLDLACDRLMTGDAAGARALRADAEALVSPSPHPGLRWHLATYDAGLAALEGRLDEGDSLARDALRVGSRARHPYAQGCFDMQTALVAFERGAPRVALERFGPLIERRGVVENAPIHWMIAFVARAALACGERARAEALWRRLADPGFEAIPRNIRWTRSIVEIAHLCADLGLRAAAAPLVALMEPCAEQHAVLPIPIGYGGPVRFALARLHAVGGDERRAGEDFARAIGAAEAIGATIWARRIREAEAIAVRAFAAPDGAARDDSHRPASKTTSTSAARSRRKPR